MDHQPPQIDLILQPGPRLADDAAFSRACAALAASGDFGRVLVCRQPSGHAAPTLDFAPDFAAALAACRGEIVAVMAPDALPRPGLATGLIRRMAEPDAQAVLGPAARHDADEPWADLLDLANEFFDQGLAAGQTWPPLPACAAFRARWLRDAVGRPGPGPCQATDLFALACRVAAMGGGVVFEPQCQARATPPSGLAGALSLQARFGRGAALAVRALRANGQVGWPWPRGWPWRVVLALAVIGLLVAFAPRFPADGALWAALGLLLFYPLERPFLKFVTENRPELLNRSLLFCLVRPFFWAWGMVRTGFESLLKINLAKRAG